ncbi:DUF3810 domain-containing protein [Algoriphagus namhaensis]|uniref:DUF3810 domain-containing protein n=1 Tax=Algoriphagus namhaensis TaxID=915353 RepID=A0ABV8AQN3_9BACT
MKIKDWFWALLGLIALIIRFFASQFPESTDRLYSKGLFPWIRISIDQTLGRLPFPSVYFFILSVVMVLVYYFIQLRRRKSARKKLGYSMQAVLNGLGAIIFFFLVLWGFNYQRTTIPNRMGFELLPLEESEVKSELFRAEQQATKLRPLIKQDTAAIIEGLQYEEVENRVREEMEQHLGLLGLEYSGKPRTKLFPPEGMMRRAGVLGIYWPFTGESYIDPSLHPLEKPFTIAHEMAHSVGVTNEGEANFVAWLVASQSDFVRLNYAAELRLMIYLMRDFARMNPEEYAVWVSTLDRGIVNDILSIRAYADRYPPISLEFSRASNDIFLKTQGVKEGIKSYQQLPMLVFAWRKSLQIDIGSEKND